MTQFFQLTDLGLAVSPTSLLQQWLSFMQQTFPGYTPQAGNLEYIQALIFASWASDVANQASQGANELFLTYGQQLAGVPPLLGSSAAASVKVSAVDIAGYTLPGGALFLLDNTYGFQSSLDAVIPPGSSSVTLPIFSVTPGSAPNGAGLAGLSLNQQLNWVSSVTLVTAAASGVDAETDDQYRDRLATALRLSAPRPITGDDYAAFVASFQPAVGTDQQEVGRATSIDGYDPALPSLPGWSSLAGGTGTFNNEREVTVCVTDVNGVALNSDTLAAIQKWLEGFREANFIVNVVSPSYTPVYITCSVVRNTGFTPAAVQQSIQADLLNLLTPANWGLSFTGGAVSSSSSTGFTGWTNTTTVFQSVVESAIQNAAGVANIVTGTLGMGFVPNPVGASDLALAGPFPMPISTAAQLPLSSFTVVN